MVVVPEVGIDGQHPDGVFDQRQCRSQPLVVARLLELARSGYVVIVPSYNSHQVISDPTAARDAALADLDWVRTGWSEAEWVDKQSAAVAGHSLGGVLAFSYSCRSPLSRSCRWTFRCVSAGGSVIGSGSGRSGRAFLDAPMRAMPVVVAFVLAESM